MDIEVYYDCARHGDTEAILMIVPWPDTYNSGLEFTYLTNLLDVHTRLLLSFAPARIKK
jgi:hypothetical protein